MKIGLLGAGGIAKVMGNTVAGLVKANTPGIEAWSVAARDLSRAQALADEYGFQKAYGSYEELVSDPEVDLIYIATPHSHHYEHAKLCLEHGKHVLCEKAFTVNAPQAQALQKLAKEKGLLITEAIWTRYMPSRKMISDILASGVIGKPSTLTANLGYVLYHSVRMHDPALAAGALLDLGVYPINFAMMAFGDDFETASASAVFTDRGVDQRDNIVMTWKDSRMAVLMTDMHALTDRQGVISGDKGYLEVQNINNPEEIRVYDLARKLVAKYAVPEQISGYEYEVLACRDALAEGRLECPEMPHATTLQVMELMDSFRKSWNMVYPCE